ncbi:UNVERIFIED_CONTAM: hypothetical protein FKN15_037524 [Acipenser sinensis]
MPLPLPQVSQCERDFTRSQKVDEVGVIEPSRSEWYSKIVIVTKKDGTNHFCVDFCKIKAIAKFDAYPMPRVDKRLDRLRMVRFILTKRYWQIHLTRSSREKTGTPEGLFHLITMPFGLYDAPAVFQRLRDYVNHPNAFLWQSG